MVLKDKLRFPKVVWSNRTAQWLHALALSVKSRKRLSGSKSRSFRVLSDFIVNDRFDSPL